MQWQKRGYNIDQHYQVLAYYYYNSINSIEGYLEDVEYKDSFLV